jgi:hypothetical protein
VRNGGEECRMLTVPKLEKVPESFEPLPSAALPRVLAQSMGMGSVWNDTMMAIVHKLS